MNGEFVVREVVVGVEFRILSPKMVENMSVINVVTPELYDVDGYPVEGGLMDLRMGIVDPGLRCRTCGAKVKECPGHFGSIDLARPVIHIKHVRLVYDFLRGTCPKCNRIKLSDEQLQKFDKKIEKYIEQGKDRQVPDLIKQVSKKAQNTKKCAHCEEPSKKVKLIKPSSFTEEDIRLTPIDVRERFERIPDNDLRYFGLDPMAGRPEWTVLTILPVPPVTVRPSITLESGARSEDDLTHKLGDIVRTNQRLFENLDAGAPEIIIEDLWDLLQYHVTTLFVNNVSQIPPARHRSGRPLKTLAERIKSKEGRFRKNLAGKRVDFSARTVISPDPEIKINEVGIPLAIARELTVPERVNEWNIKWLKNFIKNADTYPGANYVITPENKRKKVTEETKEAILDELEFGYIVERNIIDGDITIFNRQPSLHKMSMMMHKAKVLPYNTFRINPCTTTPYNADFDGDEMNLHIPQTEEARSESEELLDVYKNIISPRFGNPIIGCIQDHLTGSYLLTQEDKFLTKDEACDLLMKAGITVELPKPAKKNLWSGKQIFSLLLPNDFNYEGDPKKRGSGKVVVKNGKLISGAIDSKAIGARGGKLLHKYYMKYGPEKTGEFLQSVSSLGIATLMMFGFSNYISDTDLPEKLVKQIRDRLEEAEAQSYELIYQYKEGKMESYPGKTMREVVESRIMIALNRARNDTSKIVESYLKDSPTIVMADSGAKGSALNLALIAASVGQQALRGSRISKGYYDRTLPHFERGDLSPIAKGFVRHGYKGGLNAFEFFFHAVTGRDSMMDTSMRTPKSGYLQRRLVNALIDLKVHEDKSVRDSSGIIVQFKYGDDGLDLTKSDAGKIPGSEK